MLLDLLQDKLNAAAGEVQYEGLNPTQEDEEKAFRALQDAAFVQRVRAGSGSQPLTVYQLTERGESAARILMAQGPIPEWAEDLFDG